MKLENYPRMLLSALPILLSLIVSSLTFAQGTQVDEVRLSAEMAQLKERLDLTEEQATQGRPIIKGECRAKPRYYQRARIGQPAGLPAIRHVSENIFGQGDEENKR
jgi:hypothetical protein